MPRRRRDEPLPATKAHYQWVIVALRETTRLMDEVDHTVELILPQVAEPAGGFAPKSRYTFAMAERLLAQHRKLTAAVIPADKQLYQRQTWCELAEHSKPRTDILTRWSLNCWPHFVALQAAR